MAKTIKNKFICFDCKKEYVETNFYKSYSNFYKNIGKIPYCKQCIEKYYQYYYDKYINEGCLTPERNAVKRLCMVFDIYYREDVLNSAMNKIKSSNMNISPMGQYMKTIQLSQYTREQQTYDNTINEEEKENFSSSFDNISDGIKTNAETIRFFGSGFTDEDYDYLKKEYDDWTARHECNTKAQEEVFKGLCFTQLKKLKAERKNEDTKDLDATFLKQMEAAKLQPKQNKGDTTAETQTFGTLIDKWENTRPLPEIDEELKDVDKIGLYLDVFFKGHLAKMMGLKNGFSRLYSNYMKKYTVEKPEYESDEDSEALFDAIFGNSSDKDDDEGVV